MTMNKGKFWITAGIILLVSALCLTAYNFFASQRAKAEAESAVEKINTAVAAELKKSGKSDKKSRKKPTDGEKDMPTVTVEGRDYVGTVIISALGLELPVLNECNSRNLTHAPCRYFGSVYKNDMVICAHNYVSHFGRLRRLCVGDTVIFKDVYGNKFNYKIVEFETLSPLDTDEMKTDNYGLTLFTCTPGGSTRVTLRCEKSE